MIDSSSKTLQFNNQLKEAISKLNLFFLSNSLELKILIGTVIIRQKIKKIRIICSNSIIFSQHNNSFYFHRLFHFYQLF